MNRLFILRYDETAAPGIGQNDLPLKPEGVEQMQARSRELSVISFTAAWATPFAKARQGAKIILRANPVNTTRVILVPAFREIDMGVWQGKTEQEVRRADPKLWAARFKQPDRVAPPEGENYAMLANRVLRAFATVRKEASERANSLLVIHSSVMRVIVGHLTGLPLDQVLTIDLPTAALFVLDFESGRLESIGTEKPV